MNQILSSLLLTQKNKKNLKIDNYYSKLLLIKYFPDFYTNIKNKNFTINYKKCKNITKLIIIYPNKLVN
jgi:hypothetical protein